MTEKYTPKTIREASDFLQKNPSSHPIGSGTRIRPKEEDREILVDISPLGLDYIDILEFLDGNEIEQEVVFGATTPLQKVADAPVLKKFAGGLLAEAASQTLLLRLARGEATVGGEIGLSSPSSPFLAALIALESMVRIFSKNYADWKALETLYSMEGSLVLQRGEILEEILVPSDHDKGTSALEFIENESLPSPIGIAMCMSIEKGKIESLGAAGISLSASPFRFDDLEGKLQGRKPEIASLEFSLDLFERELPPPSNLSLSPEIWNSWIKTLFTRAFEKCCGNLS